MQSFSVAASKAIFMRRIKISFSNWTTEKLKNLPALVVVVVSCWLFRKWDGKVVPISATTCLGEACDCMGFAHVCGHSICRNHPHPVVLKNVDYRTPWTAHSQLIARYWTGWRSSCPRHNNTGCRGHGHAFSMEIGSFITVVWASRVGRQDSTKYLNVTGVTRKACLKW